MFFVVWFIFFFFFFKQKTAYEMRISDWSSDVCSSDLLTPKSTFRDGLPEAEWQLVLEPPVAGAGLNTTRIALQRSATQIEYYARSGWADRAPLMIQTLRSEELRVGKECVRTCITRGQQDHLKTKTN